MAGAAGPLDEPLSVATATVANMSDVRAQQRWAAARAFGLGLPGAWEDFPWGENVAKAGKKIFAFLGEPGRAEPRFTVKLTDEELHAHALSIPGAEPAGYGLGKSGWVTVPLGGPGAPEAEVLCDWVEESYRAVAPKRLVAELEAAGPAAPPAAKASGRIPREA